MRIAKGLLKIMMFPVVMILGIVSALGNTFMKVVCYVLGPIMLIVYCKIELPKVANGNRRMLHLQIGESCKTFARSSQERCSA